MKKISILGIIGMITISFMGCNINSNVENSKPTYENVSTDVKSDKDSKKISGEIDININSNETIDEKIPLEDVNNINIEISAAKVSVNSYDGDEVKITGKLSEKSKGMNINKSDSKFKIVEKGYQLKGSLISDEHDVTKIDVLIPSKFTGDFIFNQGVGTSEIEGIKVKTIDITGGTGNLKCDDIKFDKLNLNSGVGKVDLNLKEKCGDIEINGSVGETNVKMAEVGGNLKYRLY